MTMHYTLPPAWWAELEAAAAERRNRPKTETEIWLESDHVTAWCRDREVERLELEGEIVGGLS